MSRFQRIPQVVYHGTSSNHLSSLSKGIDVTKCEPIADFGQEFYVTTNFNRACERARLKANVYQKLFGDSSVFPVVINYRINVPIFKQYAGYTYHSRDEEWIRFIYGNRSIVNPQQHTYNHVIGYVADGKITELIEDVDNGTMSLDDLLLLVTQGYADYDQISFHNNNVVKCLFKQREVKVHEKVKRT